MSTKERLIDVLLRSGAVKNRDEAERVLKEAEAVLKKKQWTTALKSPLVGFAGFWS
jgi:hypothetical protein